MLQQDEVRSPTKHTTPLKWSGLHRWCCNIVWYCCNHETSNSMVTTTGVYCSTDCTVTMPDTRRKLTIVSNPITSYIKNQQLLPPELSKHTNYKLNMQKWTKSTCKFQQKVYHVICLMSDGLEENMKTLNQDCWLHCQAMNKMTPAQ
jgi:hypothetical protein